MTDDMKHVTWPGWETVGILGRGSFGAVYEIRREVFKDTERAALKVISIPQNSSDIDDMYSDGYDEESISCAFQSHLESIVAEYSLARKMNGSAHIVNCDDIRYVQHPDGIGWDVFIKMELLTPLSKAFTGSLPAEELVIKAARDICSALVLCKKHNIIHRDIKPQNIFLSDNGDFKLGDFGIAKTVEKTMGGTKIGTYKYMSPEVYHNKPYGSAADVYSLGLVLYWMLNERRMPFMPLPPQTLRIDDEENSKNRRLEGEQIPPPAHGSRRLQEIVLKACAYDPRDRYVCASAMLEDLNRAFPVGFYPEQDAPMPGVLPPQEESPKTVVDDSLAQEAVNQPDRKPEQRKPVGANKKIGLGIALGAVALGLFLLLRSCGSHGGTPGEPAGQNTVAATVSTTVPPQTLPAQLEWSEWSDTLPDYVDAQAYEIEERILFSTRTLQTQSSTTQDSMEGWELYETVEGTGDYGPWSDWQSEKVTQSDTRQVETETRYKYRDKETTTGKSSSKSGWELYDTTYSWGEYGAWSNWSTTAVSANSSREVEKKTQYSARSIWIREGYSDWSSWSGWSFTRESTGDLKKEEIRTVWGYYYFACPNCGAHMHVSSHCFTWAGGCGLAQPYLWNEMWSPVSWDNAGLRNWHGTGHYYTYLDGLLVFKWSDGNGDPRAQYRYATRTIEQVVEYGSWSSYSDQAIAESDTKQVRTRTVYRYRDRPQVPTYHFYRWGPWSDWSANEISESNNRQVETALVYRYRDQAEQTTYYFRRWSDWSDYSEQTAEETDTQQVQTQKQYRFKSKENP